MPKQSRRKRLLRFASLAMTLLSFAFVIGIAKALASSEIKEESFLLVPQSSIIRTAMIIYQ